MGGFGGANNKALTMALTIAAEEDEVCQGCEETCCFCDCAECFCECAGSVEEPVEEEGRGKDRHDKDTQSNKEGGEKEKKEEESSKEGDAKKKTIEEEGATGVLSKRIEDTSAGNEVNKEEESAEDRYAKEIKSKFCCCCDAIKTAQRPFIVCSQCEHRRHEDCVVFYAPGPRCIHCADEEEGQEVELLKQEGAPSGERRVKWADVEHSDEESKVHAQSAREQVDKAEGEIAKDMYGEAIAFFASVYQSEGEEAMWKQAHKIFGQDGTEPWLQNKFNKVLKEGIIAGKNPQGSKQEGMRLGALCVVLSGPLCFTAKRECEASLASVPRHKGRRCEPSESCVAAMLRHFAHCDF